MTQYQVTVDEATVQQVLQRDDGLAQLVSMVLDQVMEAQVTERLRADRYERTKERQGYRNGTRPRRLTTRVGTVELQVPQVREGQFSTELFARYQRSEQALVLALMEMVVNGVSTRNVQRITKELCETSFSKSTVSALCQRLDPLVAAWNDRDLSQQRYPFLIVDALMIKVGEAGRVRAQSMLIVTGVNEDGCREVLVVQVGESEFEQSWRALFIWLKERGLQGVDLVVPVDHGGLVSAIAAQL